MKKYIKRIINNLGYNVTKFDRRALKTKEKHELQRLRGLQPGTESSTDILGFPLKIACPSTFTYLYEEIWHRGIYSLPEKVDQLKMIDCGANIGLASIFIKKKFPDAEIIAIEADPDIYKILNDNLRNFGYSDVETIHAALTASGNKCEFEQESGGTGGRIGSGDILVPAQRLSSFIKTKIDFLKIDIEGSEVEVIEEVGDLIKNVNFIVLEYHSFAGSDQHLARILAKFENFGFRYFLETSGPHSEQPFRGLVTHKGYDNLVNIFAINQKL